MSTGSLFKTGRLNRVDFEKYCEDVFHILRENNVEYFTPYYYDDKMTFGDLDIIVKKPFGRDEIFSMFRFNKTQYNVNSNVHSICYKNFQIDFITTKPNQFEITKDYYAWADLSIIIGRMIKKFNLSFGWDGLTYREEIKIDGDYRKIGDIFVSNSMMDILGFLGLDYNTYLKGFRSKKDLLEYVTSSKYFNPKYFESVRKSEDRRNNLFADVLAYSYNMNRNFIDLTEFSKTDVNIIIASHFKNVDFINESNKLIKKANMIKTNSDKFNGNIVMGITKYQGKELGDFIKYFKEFIKKNYSSFSDFNEYVYETKEFFIVRDIKMCLEMYKKC